MAKAFPTDKPVLFFDGVCNLCNGYVQFVIDRDPEGRFRFASLQSKAGEQVLRDLQMSEEDLKTVILFKNGRYYTHSDVALEMARDMGGFWSLGYGLKVIPKFIRDSVYNLIAANRYRWFGKEESCRMPDPDLQSRFLN